MGGRNAVSLSPSARPHLSRDGPLMRTPVLLFVAAAAAFNLDPLLPVVKKGSVGSYFGYSVAQHATSSGLVWLLVGAPLGQNLQPNTSSSGALFKCPVTGFEHDCEQVVTDGKRAENSDLLHAPLESELKDGQWLGVNVRSQGAGGKVAVCAHRYVNQGPDFRWAYGLCHFLDQSLAYDQELVPCAGKQRRGLEDYGYCQAGTSVQILPDHTALFGVPGAFTCRGIIYGISVSSDFLNKDNNRYVSAEDLPKYSYLGMAVIGDTFRDGKLSYAAGAPKAANGSGLVYFFSKEGKEENLRLDAALLGEGFASGFGYELASLDLNGDKLPDIVVGAPFWSESGGSGGAAFVYLNSVKGFGPHTKPIRLSGPFESRFGLAIASLGDLNRDGYADLAIGAPYEDEGRGAVYVFLGSGKGVIREASQVIRAKRHFPALTTFGTSLSGGMDVDSNGYPDLLVGAFDSDAAVLLRARPIIDISTTVTGNLTDIDPNRKGCPEDPTSPFICFGFETCFEIRNLSKVPASSLGVEYRLEAETFTEGKKFSRVTLKGGREERGQVVNRTVQVRQSGSGRYCSREIAYLRESVRDIQSPIPFRLSLSLLQREPDFVPNRLPNMGNYPILNEQEASRIFIASFEKDCGDNDLCESNLFVTATSHGLEMMDDEFLVVLGHDKELMLNVSLQNFGEPAYEASLFVSHPASMPYVGRMTEGGDFGCSPFNATVVACPLGNPYKNRGLETVGLRFDLENVGETERRVEFKVWANSTSLELESDRAEASVLGRVVARSEVEVSGRGEPSTVFYGGAVVGESGMKSLAELGPRVIHRYEVWNEGPWRAAEITLDVWWPWQVENGRQEGKWLLYPEGPPVLDGDGSCSVPSETSDPLSLSRPRRETEQVVLAKVEVDAEGKKRSVVELNCVRGSSKCIKIRCVIKNLLAHESAVFRLAARVWNGTLVEDYATVDEVRIRSRAEVRLGSGAEVKWAEATTMAFPDLKLKPEEGVGWWVYALSVLAGVTLLALIVACLARSGFFRRRRPHPTHSASLLKH